ncbi:hypothetical protein JMN32_19010, partial [Fulvivirga sp. 29W222]
MTIEKFINELSAKGISFSFVDKEVKVKGDHNLLTNDVIREIKSRKDELQKFFSNFNQQVNVGHIPPAPEQLNYPLTSAQKRLYFLYEFDPETTAYNMPYVVSLKGQLNIQRLENTFSQLIQRHQSLRTRFVRQEQQVFQQIMPPEEVPFNIHVHEEVPEGNIEELIRSFVRPFD